MPGPYERVGTTEAGKAIVENNNGDLYVQDRTDYHDGFRPSQQEATDGEINNTTFDDD